MDERAREQRLADIEQQLAAKRVDVGRLLNERAELEDEKAAAELQEQNRAFGIIR